MSDTEVKGYQILELLGRGASSEVFRARHIKTRRIVALKVVRRGAANSARYFRQIENEFRIAGPWDHPNLVKLHEIVASGFLFLKFQVALSMEYVPGAPLKAGAGVTAADVISYFTQIADGMHYMHQKGYIHLDMKPQNVIVTPDKRAKIMDFGLCTKIGQYNPRLQGTPDFMAPEQMRKGWVDERTDVYNLGATIFHVLSGKSVSGVVGTGRDVILMPAAFHTLNVEVPEELENLIFQCTKPSPAERPATMQRVKEQLEEIRKTLGNG
jgi:eukaryotic-like serine/threonine-protein kinase